jgi:tRNA-specific 2-thiouridylase
VEASLRILACMSGGVDSSVAAARLVREGHEVIGLFLSGAGGAGPDAPPPAVDRAPRGCCSARDAADAAAVADRLGIPFHSGDFSEGFEGLVEGFVAEYLRGRTPNPCVLCNRDLKFGRAREWAAALGCDAVATGHYARVGRRDGRWALLRGADAAKDQSYVLFPLSQDALAGAVFPLGELRKEEVRAEARALGLAVADKPDSQEICFVPGGDYRDLVRERAGERLQPGRFRGEDGEDLGAHGGAALFTPGQRRGLPATGRGRPLYVTGIDAGTGTVTLGDPGGLLARSVEVAGWNPVAARVPAPGDPPVEGFAKVRRSHEPQRASATASGDGRITVAFAEPVRAPAPGQALVLYDAEGAVLGGGWIEAATRVAGPAAAAARAGP